jgi:hypothetical protein
MEGRGYPQPYKRSPAEQARAGDAFQRPLRSRFQARLTRGVRLRSKTGLRSQRHMANIQQHYQHRARRL